MRRSAEAASLASPLAQFEAVLQPWALGVTWAQMQADWQRRLGRVASGEALDPEGELVALCHRLFSCMQPMLAGAVLTTGRQLPRKPSNPFKGRLQAIQAGAADTMAAKGTAAGGATAGRTLETGVFEVTPAIVTEDTEVLPVGSVCVLEKPSSIEAQNAGSITAYAASCMASSEGDDDDNDDPADGREYELGGADEEHVAAGGSIRNESSISRTRMRFEALPTHAEDGTPLMRSRQSPTGYRGVIRKGSAFALRRNPRYSISGTATYPTATSAALEYARAVAAAAAAVAAAAAEREALAKLTAEREAAMRAAGDMLAAEADVWLAPDGTEHLVHIDSLAKFCRQRELTRSSMLSVRRGMQSYHKEWRCDTPTAHPCVAFVQHTLTLSPCLICSHSAFIDAPHSRMSTGWRGVVRLKRTIAHASLPLR